MNESSFYRKSKRLQIYKIVDKKQQTVPFKRNAVQQILEKRKKELKDRF
jgi:hypothetical protein